jgi:methylmalonyl-CoA/ethylmalonyl-CoA epimerase
MITQDIPAFLAPLQPQQLGFVVPDLAEGIRIWSALLGRDDWAVYTYTPASVPEMTFRGSPGSYAMQLALIGNSPQVELIQPLAGPSVYHEWIERHGYGLHHVGFFVPSVRDVLASAERAGVTAAQTGRGYGVHGDGGFAYFDTAPSTGVMLEAIEVPSQRRPSEPIPR